MSEKHISFSEIKEWTICPYKRKLLYEDRISGEGSIFACFGKALHEICDIQLSSSYTTSDYSEQFSKLFLKELKKNYKNDLSEKDFSLICDMRNQIENIIPQFLPEMYKVFGDYEVFSIEDSLMEKTNIMDYNFKGFVDVILKTNDIYHILDLKSCGWGWDSMKKNNKMVVYQLVYYKYFISQKYNIPIKNIRTYFALLKRTAKQNNVEIFEVKFGERKIKNSLDLLKKVIVNIEKKCYIKNRINCTKEYVCPFYGTEYCK